MRIYGLLLLLATLISLPARAGSLADLEVHDRETGRILTIYHQQGRSYVAGEPGHEYELLVRNHGSGRLLAVTSVDGVNVISGDTAAPDQGGYVLESYGSTSIQGWRKSLARIATFYFTALPDSYAARTARPDDVGVIGVALFRERISCCRREMDRAYEGDSAAGAPSAGADAKSMAAAPPAAERLGTGHGRSEQSEVTTTEFVRASETPDETIAIYYDSRRNLVAQGVIPSTPLYAQRRPDPFPGRFVADP